jgi:hypothetical protein
LLQFGQYVTKDGPFADEALWLKAQTMPAWKWWLVNGGHVPELQVCLLALSFKVHKAKPVLALPLCCFACLWSCMHEQFLF